MRGRVVVLGVLAFILCSSQMVRMNRGSALLGVLAFFYTVPARSEDGRDDLIKQLTDRVAALEDALASCRAGSNRLSQVEQIVPAHAGRVLLATSNASDIQLLALINASWLRVEKRFCDAVVARSLTATDALTECIARGATCVAISDEYCSHSTFSLCAPGSLRGYGSNFDGTGCIWIDPNRTFTNSSTPPPTQTPSSQITALGFYSKSSGRCFQVHRIRSSLTVCKI
jgi:hypothetical protein